VQQHHHRCVGPLGRRLAVEHANTVDLKVAVAYVRDFDCGRRLGRHDEISLPSGIFRTSLRIGGKRCPDQRRLRTAINQFGLSAEVQGFVELRDIEIFLTLAEELHFGRTADRLHLSQARVSQVIQKLERRIGTPLFDRTSRRVSLTPVGRRLREDLRHAHDLVQTALARARAAGEGLHGVLRLEAMGVLGHALRPYIETFRIRYPDCHVQLTEVHFSDPFAALRARQTDLHLLWLPIREPDLTPGPVVLTEGRVLAVGTGNPLAERCSADLEDLGDHPVIDHGPAVPDYWAEAMIPRRTPGGRPIRRGPGARTFHEVMSLVAAGDCVCPLNAHVTRYYSHPGVTFLPISDAQPTEWALTWPTAHESLLVRAFAETARELGPRSLSS
jgi:DNA-binding transcriptional LysR family regulator